jgi:hypothetical protein
MNYFIGLLCNCKHVYHDWNQIRALQNIDNNIDNNINNNINNNNNININNNINNNNNNKLIIILL